MESSSEKTELAPPNYASCVPDNAAVAPLLDQFDRIVGNHEQLHFHSPNRMGLLTVPEIVQIRDSTENPILSIMSGRLVVAAGNNRVLSTRGIVTPNGEVLVTINGGSV